MQLPAERYIPILAKTVKETFNADKVAVMYANNEYAKGMWDGTLPALEEYGIEAELVQTFNDGTTDFTPQLLAIKNAGLDILFLYCYEAEQALVMRQLKELGMDNVKVLAGRGGDNPAVKELVGEQFMEGFVCSTSLSPGSPDPGIQEFVKKYEEKWKDELSPTHSNHYDSIYILADIIGRVGTDAEKICNELRNLDYKGVLGHYQCDSKKDLVHTVYSHMYENGQWKLLNELKYPENNNTEAIFLLKTDICPGIKLGSRTNISTSPIIE